VHFPPHDVHRKADSYRKERIEKRIGRSDQACPLLSGYNFIARCCAVVILGSTTTAIRAQELEPRAYSPNPIGINFILTGASHSSGDVVFDPSSPLEDVSASINAGILGYGRIFGWFGRSASATIAVPYVWGDVSGNVGEDRRAVERAGAADTRLRLAINLIGGEALTPHDFARRKPQTSLGTSLVVVAPTGEYDGTKLINIGANRWAFKPEIGLSHPLDRWFFEAYAGVWFFTANDDYYGGTRREQEYVTALQAHVSYTFRPQLWLAGDVTYYRGGRTSIDGVSNANLQENLRMGLTLSVPLTGSQSLKLSWSDGTSTRIGGDFTTYALAWQYAWFDD
jgi:hypothetical protein